MTCPILTWRMIIRFGYGMSGTDMAYDHTLFLGYVPVTDIVYVLCLSYAMSSTDMGCSPWLLLCHVRFRYKGYKAALPCYGVAVRRPVLSSGMVLDYAAIGAQRQRARHYRTKVHHPTLSPYARTAVCGTERANGTRWFRSASRAEKDDYLHRSLPRPPLYGIYAAIYGLSAAIYGRSAAVYSCIMDAVIPFMAALQP
eukprot:3940662-Rhodomonas_salina.6